MITKEILISHPVSVLKKEISKTNIKGYSKMRKLELIDLMMKPEHAGKFSHIKKGAAYIPGDLKPVKKDKKIVIKRTPKPAPAPAPKIVVKTSKKPLIKRDAVNDKNHFTPFQVSTMSTQTLKDNLNLFIDFSKYYNKDEILFYKELKDRGAKINKAVEKKYKLTISKNDKGEAKTPKPTPAPAKKRMLSPLEDIRAYLNNVNSKEYKMLRAGKEPKIGEKNWYQVLKEKLNKVMDSDIPYNIDNLFTYKKLMEFKTLKDIPRNELFKEDDVMGESINSAIQNVFTINQQKRNFGGKLTLSEIKRDRDRKANKKAAVKREGLSKVKEIININKRRKELCDLYSDKKYKNYESAEKKKERTEKIKKLSKELKDILKTFKTNLYFISVLCELEDLPKGLYEMLNEKLATKGNKSTADSIGRINELKFIAREVFKVDLKSLEN